MITTIKAAIPAYSPVAGEWYPAIEYPYPKVYHKFLNKKTFDEIYPELVNADSEKEEVVEEKTETTTEESTTTTETTTTTEETVLKGEDEDLSGNETLV